MPSESRSRESTTPTVGIAPPSFQIPLDATDPDRYEVWSLRAPVDVDVHALLDGATLDANSTLLLPSSHTTSNVLARFHSKKEGDDDGEEYALVVADDVESQDMRLLVPNRGDGDDDSDGGDDAPKMLRTCGTFGRQINLVSASAIAGGGGGENAGELALAPSLENAPPPATKSKDVKEEKGRGIVNGTVEHIRHAYAPVPQRSGLKRRWAMPGAATSKPIVEKVAAVESKTKKSRTETTAEESMVPKTPETKEKKKKDKKEKKKKTKQ